MHSTEEIKALHHWAFAAASVAGLCSKSFHIWTCHIILSWSGDWTDVGSSYSQNIDSHAINTNICENIKQAYIFIYLSSSLVFSCGALRQLGGSRFDTRGLCSSFSIWSAERNIFIIHIIISRLPGTVLNLWLKLRWKPLRKDVTFLKQFSLAKILHRQRRKKDSGQDLKSNSKQTNKHEIIFSYKTILRVGQVTKVRLSSYLFLLSFDSKTR